MSRAHANPDTGLTEKQEKFCLAYLESGNASDAYRKSYDASGMKSETIHREAKTLLDNPKIAARVKELRDAAAERAQIKEADVLREVSRLGLSDVRKLIGADGEVLALEQWSDDIAAAVASFDVIREELEDGTVRRRYRVKLWDKNSALEKLMRHFGMFDKDPTAGVPRVFVVPSKDLLPADLNPSASAPNSDTTGKE